MCFCATACFPVASCVSWCRSVLVLSSFHILCYLLSPPQSTLNLTNPNFFSVLVQSVSCQVLYMKMVIGTQQVDNPTTILPLSERQVEQEPHSLLTLRT